MCGFVGAIAQAGRRPRLTDGQLAVWRDGLAHRGPDGSASWSSGPVALGHRRLAIRDLSDAAIQPLIAPQGRGALVYNGELYNDVELRAELSHYAARYGGFATTCDAETVMFALMRWGAAALPRLRGIFALAWIDHRDGAALLARDPLGVKPLYWTRAAGEVLFASEIATLLRHPAVSAEPDLPMVSAYLTTARRELGDRTMYAGVRAVLPGEALVVSLTDAVGDPVSLGRWRPCAVGEDPGASPAAGAVGLAVRDSLVRQLVTDRPMCAMLSGGFDSTVLVKLVAEHSAAAPRTFCASGVEGRRELGPDPAAARTIAADLGCNHSLTRVDRQTFVAQWRAHVQHLATPLSTPNEVAIAEVARQMQAEGHAVALSGEGADELFAGYADVLDAIAANDTDPVAAHLGVATWVAPQAKAALLRPDVVAEIDGDALLRARYAEGFARGRAQAGWRGTVLDAHVRLQREFNLSALLQRLDAATMRYGIEGRTPYADVEVANVAEALPMPRKYCPANGQPRDPAARSKIALRTAFADEVPALALRRPKASFPLPFAAWAAELAAALPHSAFARTLLEPAVLEVLAAAPQTHWRVAWPVANLALWGESQWGDPDWGRAA